MKQLNLFGYPDHAFRISDEQASEKPDDWWLALINGPRHLWDIEESEAFLRQNARFTQPPLPFT
jgi:hypothetical protein